MSSARAMRLPTNAPTLSMGTPLVPYRLGVTPHSPSRKEVCATQCVYPAPFRLLPPQKRRPSVAPSPSHLSRLLFHFFFSGVEEYKELLFFPLVVSESVLRRYFREEPRTPHPRAVSAFGCLSVSRAFSVLLQRPRLFPEYKKRCTFFSLAGCSFLF